MPEATLVDLFAGLACLAALVAYQMWSRLAAKRDPRGSMAEVNALARAAWAERVMASGDHILAVQTLRNSTMTASFLASTAVLVVIGVLNLAAQGGSLTAFWHALSVHPEVDPAAWTAKLMVLVVLLLAAFFCFTIAIRLFNHVGYLIALPPEDAGRALPPAGVGRVLNQAGSYLALGLRAYYFAVPALFWLFGPQFAVASTGVLIWVLARTDRAPR